MNLEEIKSLFGKKYSEGFLGYKNLLGLSSMAVEASLVAYDNANEENDPMVVITGESTETQDWCEFSDVVPRTEPGNYLPWFWDYLEYENCFTEEEEDSLLKTGLSSSDWVEVSLHLLEFAKQSSQRSANYSQLQLFESGVSKRLVLSKREESE